MTLPASGPLTFSDIQTEFGGTNPIALNEYYAGGGLVPAGTSGTYGAVPSSGQISVQNFYGTTAFTPVYIEEVFSTWLYIGNGSTQTITNGIDLSGNGGLVWTKKRTSPDSSNLYNVLTDTVRGATQALSSNLTNAQFTENGITAFNSTGFNLGSDGAQNQNNSTQVAWTFREQPKFFDVVTYTGAGTANPSNISHNLGATPGFIIIKRYSAAGDNWICYHRSLGNTQGIILNDTGAAITSSNLWNNTSPTSTQFTVGTSAAVNGSGSYVAYLFAHNAGGFGATGTDNVISCGSYTGDGGAGTTAITLGYEPQWILVKATSGSDNWGVFDNMRGLRADNTASNDARLIPNGSNAEGLIGAFEPTATGLRTSTFTNYNQSGVTYIYVAIRRGPMKVPTVGTSVYIPDAGTNGTNGGIVPIGFPVDLSMTAYRSLGGVAATNDRVRGYGNSTAGGSTPLMYTSETSSETSYSGSGPYFYNAWNTTITRGPNGANPGGAGIITWFMGRAPSFMDVVCYTGTAPTAQNLTHNLQAVPELIIVKRRDAVGNWFTGSMFTSTTVTRALLNVNNDQDLNSLYSGQSIWGGQPTSSVFSVGTGSGANASGGTYVAYLFATCAGVSKVGSYTGTGTTKQVDCGFAAGARFVLIKRTDSTGDWYVWDSARGIVAGNDPYLLLNSAAAEVTGTDYVDTYSAGFEITSTAPTAINASGGTYIFLAIA